MSKLDEMIRELCPDGVEYKRFDEVCTLNARIGWQRLTKAEYMSKVYEQRRLLAYNRN